ncbi:MAG TPA: mandelate racemase/muconate lactonizing enzyme family protein [Vicinamibacteria bacterium]|nr:mandelate racemase/muconate lactonizing enzyme family protein [Vicinamibacteria bacterium]
MLPRPGILAAPQGAALDRARATSGPLRIRGVEAIVIRTPKDAIPHEDVASLGPLGTTSGGRGLWDRLDHASPTRQRGYEQATLVRITTEQGLVGWGECHAPSAPRVHQRIVTDLFAPLLGGQDARQVEPLWERLYAAERVRGYSTGAHLETIAGVDLALWDLLGKYVGVPVYQLLGGRYRDQITTYATFSGTYQGRGPNTPEAVADRARAMVERGFTVIKMALRQGPGGEDFARVIAVAEAIKGRGQVLVDALGAFKLHEATLVGKELDALGNIGWFEDPLLPEDMDRYPILAERIDTAICAGEALSNRFQFKDVLASRGVDVVNPDLGRAGGITESRRIAWLADAFGVLWAPHVSTGSAPYMAASVHLALATPNAVMMEVYDGLKHEGPLGNVLLTAPLDMTPGVARASARPGLGVEFDPVALAKVTVS